MKETFFLFAFLLISVAALSQEFSPDPHKDTVAMERPVFCAGAMGTFRDKDVQHVPQNFYTVGLGFFCRQELKMQKAHIPVAFRLGSMDYCNRLEQKPGYR